MCRTYIPLYIKWKFKIWKDNILTDIVFGLIERECGFEQF
jgi:hypothetical protein